MKRNYYVPHFLLLACSISFVQCSDNDSPAEKPECHPTVLPSEEGSMTLTYNSNMQVTEVEFLNDDEPDADYAMGIEYANGKIAKVSHFEEGELNGYLSFTHSDNKIVESNYYKNGEGEFQEFTRRTYFVQNNRIVSRIGQESSNNFVTGDSAVFTYNNEGNIIRIDNYDENHNFSYKSELTYDNNINPYHVSGLPSGDNEFFDATSLSVNNPTKAVHSGQGWTEEETATFTYDGDGKPVTRKWSWEQESRNIEWTCH